MNTTQTFLIIILFISYISFGMAIAAMDEDYQYRTKGYYSNYQRDYFRWWIIPIWPIVLFAKFVKMCYNDIIGKHRQTKK